MKNRKNRGKSSIQCQDDDTFADAAAELIEALIAESTVKSSDTLEPFEQYVQRIRGKLHADEQLFRSRFFKGYEALLEELGRSNRMQ